MRRVLPSPRLAPFVRDFTIVEVSRDVETLRIPEPGVVLGVRYSGNARLGLGDQSVRLPDATCTGMLGTARHMLTSAGGGVVLARFRTGAAAPFFAMPMHELFGLTLALEDVMPHATVARLQERVGAAATDAARVAAFEDALLSRLRPVATDRIVTTALQRIDATHGNLSMRALADTVGLGQDAFEKRFRRTVGTSPKHHAMLTRLRYAIAIYTPAMRLTDLALDAGYFDQSHFNRELRAVTGQSPTRFFSTPRAHGR